MKSYRILIVNPYGIGDVLFTTPTIQILKRALTNVNVSYLCNDRVAGFLRENPLIERVFIFEKDDFRSLWRKSRIRCLTRFFSLLHQIQEMKFDITLDYSLSRQFGFFLASIGIPKRIGFNYRGRGLFLTEKIPFTDPQGLHRVSLYSQLLKPVGISPDPIPPISFPLAEFHRTWVENYLRTRGVEPSERFIAIHPGGGQSWGENACYKRWPSGYFVRLAKNLSQHYKVKILILGSASEKELADGITDQIGSGVINVCGEADLLQLAALLRYSWFAVCNDGGPLHIAVSQGIRTVSFFGPVDETVYGPFPRGDHIVFTLPLECRPCYRNFRFPPCPFEHRCLRELDPDEVFEKICEEFR